MIRVRDAVQAGALGELSGFRQEFYRCLPARADALFELAEAVLCADGPVRSLVELSLAPEHRRGHGGLYGGINGGRIEVGRLRAALASVPLPRAADGRLVLAVDVSPWLRPDAPTSAERLFCHIYGRGKGSAQMIPGLALLFHRRAGNRPQLLDRGTGRDPPEARPTMPRRSPPRRYARSWAG